MSIFSFIRRKTISEVARDFDTQLRTVKLLLATHFSREHFADLKIKNINLTGEDEKLVHILAARLSNYLTAEDPDYINDSVDDETRSLILATKNIIPERASLVMDGDKSLRELVVYTLRMKLVLSNFKYGTESYTVSPEGRRVEALLQKYGGEFKEAIDERKYGSLVRRAIAINQLKENTFKKKS